MARGRGTRSAGLGMLAVAAALGLAGAAGAAPTRETQLVSRAPTGAPGNANSSEPSVSASGRYIAFASFASNLDPPDPDGFDIYVRDRQRGTTERASVSSSGAPARSVSHAPSISGDGRFVAFESDAANLVAGDTNGRIDVFVHDRLGGRTERVS